MFTSFRDLNFTTALELAIIWKSWSGTRANATTPDELEVEAEQLEAEDPNGACTITPI